MTPQSRKRIADWSEHFASTIRLGLEQVEAFATEGDERRLLQDAIAGCVLTETALAEVGRLLAPPSDETTIRIVECKSGLHLVRPFDVVRFDRKDRP